MQQNMSKSKNQNKTVFLNSLSFNLAFYIKMARE